MSSHRLQPSRFVDARQGERCKAVVTLSDGTTADCGRRAKVEGLCTQHHKIAQRKES